MFAALPHARIVALDLETTGLVPATDRVVEVAAVAWCDGREDGHFHTLVNPGCPIPATATAIHGITDAMVADAPTLAEILPALMVFCQADAVVAHNAKFDVNFLRLECARADVPLFTSPVSCSCTLARRRLPGMPNYRLETLKRVLGLGDSQSHRALQDARDCLAIYLHCLATGLATPELPEDSPPPDRACVERLRRAAQAGETLMIEYKDGRGRTTNRAIRPIQFDPSYQIVEAYCLLRQDTRHFFLNRVRRVWVAE